jgi:hypothetical protein
MGHRDRYSPEPTIASPNQPGLPVGSTVSEARKAGSMELQPESVDRSVGASLKATYRALLARGLEAGEAANLTAFLHGLPSVGFQWSLPEVEAIIQRRIAHAAAVRAATAPARTQLGSPGRIRRQPNSLRRPSRSSSTHVIDPPRH